MSQTLELLNTIAQTFPAEFDPGNVEPDMSAPWVKDIQRILGWILGIAFYVVIIAGVIAVIGVATRGFGNQRAQEFFGKNLLTVFGSAVLLALLIPAITFFANIPWFS